MHADLDHERLAWAEGQLLIGVDEVGRGPLAGPVVAAAVCLPADLEPIEGVRDSKSVKDPRRRILLAARIRERALAWGLGAASVTEIAHHNIRVATATAMRRAIRHCRAACPPNTGLRIMIDGLPMPELATPHQALVKGDAHCHSIAAASLLAKVVRDHLMERLARRHHGYGWETNVGYATAAHIAAIRSRGVTAHHRLRFCETALGEDLFGQA